MELPSKKSEVVAVNPSSMIVFSPPKMGKTTLMAELDDCLIMDLEKGARFVKGMTVEINTWDDMLDLLKSLKAKKEQDGTEFAYTYGALDTTTKLEELILPFAASLYRKTGMGKNWRLIKGTKNPDPNADITTLPNGAGYLWTRKAMNMVSNSLQSVFKHVIFICHVKEKSINKEGTEITTRDIALTGKMAQILPANVDAVGFLHRDRKGNQFLNFQASEELSAGARPPHLFGQDIEIVSNKDGVLTYHWEKIFLPEV